MSGLPNPACNTTPQTQKSSMQSGGWLSGYRSTSLSKTPDLGDCPSWDGSSDLSEHSLHLKEVRHCEPFSRARKQARQSVVDTEHVECILTRTTADRLDQCSLWQLNVIWSRATQPTSLSANLIADLMHVSSGGASNRLPHFASLRSQLR